MNRYHVFNTLEQPNLFVKLKKQITNSPSHFMYHYIPAPHPTLHPDHQKLESSKNYRKRTPRPCIQLPIPSPLLQSPHSELFPITFLLSPNLCHPQLHCQPQRQFPVLAHV